MQMIRWMCGISLKDRRTNEELRRLVGVEPITTFIRRGERLERLVITHEWVTYFWLFGSI